MLRSLLAILTAGLLLGAVGDARAVVVDFTIDHSPVLLGESLTFRAVFDNPFASVASYKWEWQGIGKNGNLGSWNDLVTNASSTSRFMSYVGQFNMRLTVKYSPPMMG